MALRSDGLGAKTGGLETLTFLFPLAMRPSLDRFWLRCPLTFFNFVQADETNHAPESGLRTQFAGR